MVKWIVRGEVVRFFVYIFVDEGLVVFVFFIVSRIYNFILLDVLWIILKRFLRDKKNFEFLIYLVKICVFVLMGNL